MSVNRFHVPVIFVSTFAVVWVLRWGFTGSAPAHAARDSTRLQVSEALGFAGRKAPPSRDLARPEEFPSVASGLVVWPSGGGAEAVSLAFAKGWELLRKSPGGGVEYDGERLQARQLFADWLKADPEGAERFVSEPRGAFQERGGMILVALLAGDDPRRAWDLVEKAAEAHSLRGMRSMVLTRWARKSPEEVMSFAAGLAGIARLTAQEAALRGWPVEKALEWCATEPSTWRRMRAERTVVRELLSADPAKAAAMLRAGSLPVESVAEVFRDPFTSADSFARGALAREADPMSFCEWAAASGSAELARAAWKVYAEQQRDMTPAAIEALAARAGPGQGEAVATALGHTAPERALTWATKNEATLSALFSAWAEDDPAAALAGADALPDSRAARLAIAEQCLDTEPKVAVSALLEHPDKELAAPLLLKVSRPMAYENPGLALEALAAAGTATAVEVSVVMAIGGRVDPAGTAEALARYALPITDYLAVEAFTRGWATEDPEATSQWVRRLPPGELRDGGAAGLARQAGAEDPVGGYLWAREIGDPEIRGRVLSSQLERLTRDPAAMEALLSDPRLDAAQRDGLSAIFPPSAPAFPP